MPLSTLFPEASPHSVPGEPPVWIRRLVLLRSIEGEPDVIRDVPFGLGLNLIVTHSPGLETKEAIGHDVGKTLLTRLIRYLLGEARFAEGRTRAAIRRSLPDSFVAGEFRVGGRDWAVLRTLGAPAPFAARAMAVHSWRELLNVEAADGALEHFLSQVGDCVLQDISSPLLTHAHRPVQWLDVLSWIARDQRCRYADPLEWRHSESDSGTKPLLKADACSVLRSVTGLMNPREKVLFEEHDNPLRRRQEVENEKRAIETRIEAENNLLEADLQAQLDSSQVGISDIELQVIRSRVVLLRGLRADELSKLNLRALRDEYELAVKDVASPEARLAAKLEVLEATAAEIKKREQRPLTVYESFAALCDKPEDDCPAKLKIIQQRVPPPSGDELEEMRVALTRLHDEVAEIRRILPELRGRRERAKEQLRLAEEQLTTVTEGIDGKLSLYADLERRIARHLKRLEMRPRTKAEFDGLTEKINASLAVQAQVRESLEASREWLAKEFRGLCSTLLGTGRRFEVVIESKAIALRHAGAEGAPGEATSTSALVLALDLAAMRCAIQGNGHHPRFVLLDSPREADMELEIFHRLLREILAWHRATAVPNFQAIITTTTRPPKTEGFDAYVRAALSRVPASETLLRIEF